jgi:hypothetical protein
MGMRTRAAAKGRGDTVAIWWGWARDTLHKFCNVAVIAYSHRSEVRCNETAECGESAGV